ncbi:restriction endonuclease subunit S [Aeromonas veronii]|uniref:restriction endonuclease subunit S n=1 Tax=Aeromonas veronii TaxID=654 RepID=UPI0038DE3179
MAEQMKQETAGKTIPAGYKQTEVGVIPEDWSVLAISDRHEIATGNTPPTADACNYGADYLFIGPGDLGSGKYVFSSMKMLSSKGFKLARKFPAGSTLFTCIGSTIGKTGYVVDVATSNQQINAVFPNELDDSEFTYYALTNIAPKVKELAGEQAVPLVNKKDFGEMKYCLPANKQEQTAIANVLSDSDALIDALEQLIAKKQAIKSATMQQLLTGRIRLPAFALRPDGTPKGYKPSELGDIPEDWEVDFLGNISDIIRNGSNYKTVSKDGVAVTRIETIADGFIDLNRTGFASIESINGSYKVLRGDILYSHINSIDHIGKVAIFDGGSLLFHGINLVLIRSSSVIDPFWLFNFLSGEVARKWAKQVAKQAVSQASINTKELKSLLLAVPSIQEQTAIATILSDIDNELQALTQKLEKARALKQGMMQQLLTGKIRLPLAAGA